MTHTKRWTLAAAVCVWAAVVMAAPETARAGPVPAFDAGGSVVEVAPAKLAKWQGMLSRYARQAVARDDCEPDWFTSCPRNDWRDLLNAAARVRGDDRIDEVHRQVNAARYLSDQRRNGQADYWATPLELLADGGDCEDYAIAKYLALKALGMDVARMFVVVVQDRRRDAPHAVLAVAGTNGDVLLDNLYRSPLPAGQAHHYEPLYAVNHQAAYVFPGSGAYRRLTAAQQAGRD